MGKEGYNLKELQDEMVRISGGGRRLSKNRTSGLYCSINLPDFHDMRFLRNITKRFIEFGINDLTGKTVIDVGSNVGAICWEAINVGAKKTFGYEFNHDRIVLCKKLADYYDLPCEFQEADFNAEQMPKCEEKADVVIACSVDVYLEDRPRFYKWVASLVKDDGVCYFESNVQGAAHTPKFMAHELARAGFMSIKYLGNGDSGGNARKRKMYICKLQKDKK